MLAGGAAAGGLTAHHVISTAGIDDSPGKRAIGGVLLGGGVAAGTAVAVGIDFLDGALGGGSDVFPFLSKVTAASPLLIGAGLGAAGVSAVLGWKALDS